MNRRSVPRSGGVVNGDPELQSFEVRDRRGGNWHWAHNDLLKRALPHIGQNGVLVYYALTMFASEPEQTCWPSLSTIAQLLHISRDKVRHAIKKLERYRLIEVHVSKDPARTHTSNVYVLTARELWELPEENGHAQPPAQQKSTSLARKNAAKGKLCAQPETGTPKGRLESETQNAHSLCVSDSNGENPNSGIVADTPKTQMGTVRTDLCEVEKAQGNRENPGPNFGRFPLNNDHQTKNKGNNHHHEPPKAANDDDTIQLLKDLGVSNPRELLSRALREEWTPSELVDVVDRIRRIPPDKVTNPAGLLVRLIPQGYQAAAEAVARYLPEQPQGEESERTRLIREYESSIRIYLCRGLPDEDREEAKRQGLKLRAQLEQMGVDPDAIKARVLEGLWGVIDPQPVGV